MAEPSGTSLLKLVKDEIIANIIDSTAGGSQSKDGWRILVVDRPALRIISTCCRMSEIIDHGITLVEDIGKSRTPLIEFEAIYLVRPTSTNVDLIRKDFSPDARPKYRAIHIFFLDACPDNVLQRAADPRLKKVIKTFKELSLGFIPLESRVFSLDRPSSFHDAYNPKGSSENVEEIASQIASVCAVLGESPIIRYQSGRAANAKLALAVQHRVDLLRTYNAKMMASSSSKKRSQLLILDRSFDLMSPVLHELTYQASAYDLLEIQDDSFTLTFEDGQGRVQTRNVQLNEEDELWVSERHNHISSVSDNVNRSFKKYTAEREAEMKKTSGDAKQQLKSMMKDMPQHRQEMMKFSTHLELATQINKQFTRKVELCTRVEQNLVTGEEDDGTKIKDYIGQISPVLVDRSIPVDNKLRCMMLLVLALDGLKPEEMQRLFDSGNIPYSRRGAIANLEYLGATVDAAAAGKQKKKKSKRPQREVEFKLSRWTPIVKDVMEDAIKNKLSVDDYPATKESAGLGANAEAEEDADDAVSARKRGGWAKARADKSKARDAESQAKAGKVATSEKSRLIIYVIGGVSYSETRCAYEVSKAFPDWDVYIGSGCMLRPTQFLDAVEHLDEPDKDDEPDEGSIKIVKSRAKAKGGKYAEELV